MLLGCDASIRYELTNFNKGWLFNILMVCKKKINLKWKKIIKIIKPNILYYNLLYHSKTL